MEIRLVTIAGRHVQVRLEAEFWDCLEDIAVEQGATLRRLVEDVGRQHPQDVSSALRVHVLAYVQGQTELPELTIGLSPCETSSKYH